MKSLRKQLTLTLSAASAGLLLAFASIIFLASRHVMVAQFDDTLYAKANALIAAADVEGKKFEFDLSVEDFAGFGNLGGDDYFEVKQEDGNIVAASPSLGSNVLPIFALADDEQKLISAATLGNGKSARVLVMRFDPGGDKKRRYPNLQLIVASQSHELLGHLRSLALVLLICALLALLATAPLVRMLINRGLRPLEQLTKEVGNINPNELKLIIPTEGMVEELKPIGVRLNQLLARLDQSFEREKRFSSQAAHELRTPLAELKTMAEMGERWADQASPESCREMLVIIAELELILDKLALIARGDEKSIALHAEPINLATFHAALLSRYQQNIIEKNLLVHAEVDAQPWNIDRFLLTSMYQNLLDNAVSHAPPHSSIEIELRPGMIRVKNQAPELSPQDLTIMSERFWQKNPARNDSQHSGLGLSIVQTCAKLAGTSVHMTLESGALTMIIR